VGLVLLYSGEDILGLVADMILNVNLGGVDAIKTGIYGGRVDYTASI